MRPTLDRFQNTRYAQIVRTPYAIAREHNIHAQLTRMFDISSTNGIYEASREQGLLCISHDASAHIKRVAFLATCCSVSKRISAPLFYIVNRARGRVILI